MNRQPVSLNKFYGTFDALLAVHSLFDFKFSLLFVCVFKPLHTYCYRSGIVKVTLLDYHIRRRALAEQCNIY